MVRFPHNIGTLWQLIATKTDIQSRFLRIPLVTFPTLEGFISILLVIWIWSMVVKKLHTSNRHRPFPKIYNKTISFIVFPSSFI